MKLQPHLRKMFDFHTLVILVWWLTPMQTPRPTHGLLLEQQSNHSHPGHHHRHHHRHHYPRQQQLSHYHHTTPRIEDEDGEATTNTPLSLMDDNAITNREDEELLLFKGINSWSSSTTKPARHYRHQHYNHRHHSSEQQDKNQSRNGQHLILTSSSLSSPTSAASTSSKSSFSNSILEQQQQQQQQHHHHTHHQRGQPHHPHPQQSSSAASSPTQRLGPTPLPPLPSYFLSATTQKHNHPAGHGNGDGGGHQRGLSSKAAEDASPAERSKFSTHKAVSLERDNYQRPQQHHHQEHQNQNHHPTKHLHTQTKDLTMKRDYDDDDDLQGRHTRTPQEDADYYEEYNDGEDAEDDNEEEDDIDGFADDTDNNLSDRSYARITRSKLDDDYVDDEPYRNALDEEMQGDAPGVLTEQKYQELGNEKGVQQARERYIQEQKRPRTPHELATEHWQRMIHATKCRKPMPRVIPVSNNTSKRYEPYATILHRCGEDTGCCGSTASVCTVKRQEVVMVYVFSYDFNYRKEIEALPMQNHTECHCVNRASLQYESMPRGKRSGSWQHHHPRSSQLQKPPHHHQHKSHLQASAAAAASPMSRSDITSPGQPQYHHYSENMLSCHCPRHFSALEEDVERYAHLPRPHTVVTRKCRCDCLANNPTCLRFKHGEEGFALEDRKCIGEHDCKPPVCAFGEYNAQSGRCPTYRSHGKPKF